VYKLRCLQTAGELKITTRSDSKALSGEIGELSHPFLIAL